MWCAKTSIYKILSECFERLGFRNSIGRDAVFRSSSSTVTCRLDKTFISLAIIIISRMDTALHECLASTRN